MPLLYPQRSCGLYRRCAAVMSALRTGYVFCPKGKKLRSDRDAVTFLWREHTTINLCTARECPYLPLRREVDFCAFRRKKTEGEIHRVCEKTVGIDEN